jgi:hypothetical protein
MPSAPAGGQSDSGASALPAKARAVQDVVDDGETLCAISTAAARRMMSASIRPVTPPGGTRRLSPDSYLERPRNCHPGAADLSVALVDPAAQEERELLVSASNPQGTLQVAGCAGGARYRRACSRCPSQVETHWAKSRGSGLRLHTHTALRGRLPAAASQWSWHPWPTSRVALCSSQPSASFDLVEPSMKRSAASSDFRHGSHALPAGVNHFEKDPTGVLVRGPYRAEALACGLHERGSAPSILPRS